MNDSELTKNPAEELTFLFTDIEGSTQLAQRLNTKLTELLEIHNSILSDCVESNNGHVFKIVGDAFCCAFKNPEDAVNAAKESQKKLLMEKWKDAKIKVRMGIHTGPAERNGSDYMGYITLARTQRIMSAGYGNQILISEDTFRNLGELNHSEFSFRDMGLRRLKDLIQPINLYQLLSPDLPSAFPPLKTLDSRPNNLPIQLSSFIGRNNELSELKELISSSSLLTLLGPGGTGKTRMSLQVCAELIDEYKDGVWFTELASLNDPYLIPFEIIKVLDIKDQSEPDPVNVLAEFLQDKELILILDNCEHLINDCALLAEKIIKNCPKVKIIATSRETLKISGERIYKLLSMSVPDPGNKISTDELVKYESIRLFIERALSVNREFRVNDDNAESLAEICFRLDGIPLAIELAAARTKILNIRQLNEKLSDRFKLLKSGGRTYLPRQQTLKALIDWSYELLPEKEKTLWQRLSVFSGGFTIKAAEIICSCEKLPCEEIPELINNLIEKSILIFDPGNNRYKMLETIKQYGYELLSVSDELNEIKNSYVKFYYDFIMEASPKLKGSEMAKYINLFDSEQSNIESVLELSEESGMIKEGAEITISLGRYWSYREYNHLGYKWCTLFLKFRNELPPLIYANLYNWAGQFSSNQGKYDLSEKYFKECLKLYEELNIVSWIASTLNSLSALYARKGDFENAYIQLEKCLLYQKNSDNKQGISGVNCNLAQLDILFGNFDKAQERVNVIFEISKNLGDKMYLYFANRLSGQIAYLYGNFEEAERFYNESIKINREVGYKVGICGSLTELAEILSCSYQRERAESLLAEAMEIAEVLEEKFYLAMAMNVKGSLSLKKGNLEDALKELKISRELYTEINEMNGLARAFSGLGEVYFEMKDYENSFENFMKSFKMHFGMKNKNEMPGLLFYFSKFTLADTRHLTRDDSVTLYKISEKLKISMGLRLHENDEKIRRNIFKEMTGYELTDAILTEIKNDKELNIDKSADILFKVKTE